MTLHIQGAGREHLDWLMEHDAHVGAEWVGRCIDLNEYLLAASGSETAGFLRFSLFWGRIPYMEMIWVADDRRRQGVGTALFEAWQAGMCVGGAKILMTSSVGDEPEPQAWHRRNGFRESGRLTFGKAEPGPEIFFTKDI